MKTYKYHYVYRITNIVEQKYYYGSRSTNLNPNEDIGKKYFSSFTESWFKIDQIENPNNYKYKVIRIFTDSRKSANDYESLLHERFDVMNHNKFYNKANQKPDGFDGMSVRENVDKMVETRKSKGSFKTGARKGVATRENTYIGDKTIAEISIEKTMKTKSEINPKTGKTPNEVMTEKVKLACNKIIDESNQLTMAQVRAKKVVTTKNKIDPLNGKNIHKLSGEKSKESRLKNIDNEGLNGFERTGKKVAGWCAEIDKRTGLTNGQKRALKTSGSLKSKIDENGLNHYERLSTKFKGSQNPSAKKIIIFDSNDEILFESCGDFKELCQKHNLPRQLLYSSYSNNGEKLYQTERGRKAAIRNNREFLIGAYAKVM